MKSCSLQQEKKKCKKRRHRSN